MIFLSNSIPSETAADSLPLQGVPKILGYKWWIPRIGLGTADEVSSLSLSFSSVSRGDWECGWMNDALSLPTNDTDSWYGDRIRCQQKWCWILSEQNDFLIRRLAECAKIYRGVFVRLLFSFLWIKPCEWISSRINFINHFNSTLLWSITIILVGESKCSCPLLQRNICGFGCTKRALLKISVKSILSATCVNPWLNLFRLVPLLENLTTKFLRVLINIDRYHNKNADSNVSYTSKGCRRMDI